MTKPLVWIAVVVGVLFLIIAVVYFMQPANSLPSFFPGYDSALSKHHFKHGIGALLLGLAAFALAWFNSGKKSSGQNQQ